MKSLNSAPCAFLENHMKINFSQTIETLEGQPYQMEGGKSMTLGGAIVAACSMPLPDDEKLSMVEKFKIGEIAMLSHKGMDLTAEQISSAKERIAKGFTSPTLIYILHAALEAGSVSGKK
jgi:hypothetical protein